MSNIKEVATEYAKKMNGNYFDELFPNTDETIGEIGIKDFTAGYDYGLVAFSNLIKEALEYLREDCSYASIDGIIEYGDIDQNIYKKEDVEEQSFNHIFQHSYGTAMEDCYTGKCLIPFTEYKYLVCEWGS